MPTTLKKIKKQNVLVPKKKKKACLEHSTAMASYA